MFEIIIALLIIGTITGLFVVFDKKLNPSQSTSEVIEEPTIDVKSVEEAKVETIEETPVVSKPKRARNKGKFVGDDKSTTEKNEAWEGGEAPVKKDKPKKPRKPKMTVAK